MTSPNALEPAAVLLWTIATRDAPAQRREGRFVASDVERRAVASALDLDACEALSFDYVLRNRGDGRYRLTGRLVAAVVQSCVVTLDPVPATVEAAIDVEFRPDADPRSTHDIDLDDETDIEPIEHGEMAVGRVVVETLATSLDPYPRKPGATFEGASTESRAEKSDNPFAVLANLKKGS